MTKGINEMIDLAACTQVQAGSVVSRTLLNKPHGTLTVFAFDEGQELSEHTSPYDATVLVVEGEAVLTVDGKPNHVQAGNLFIMPANVPHNVSAEKPFKMLLIMIR